MKKIIYVLTVSFITVFLVGNISACTSTNFLSADSGEVTEKPVDLKKQKAEEERARKLNEKQLLKIQKEEEAKAKKAAAEEAKQAAIEAKKASANQSAEEKAAAKASAKAKEEEERIAAAEAKKKAAEEKAAAKLAEKEAKINFAGFGDAAESKTFEDVHGIIKYTVVPSRGSFNIATINEDGKVKPVFTTANEYNSTSFYLRKDGRIIKLNEDLGIRRAARKTEKGFQIAYQMDNVALVIVDFECLNSVVDGPEDTIKITASVKSLYKKKADFDLKLVMDTVLGETDKYHFYRYDNSPIKNEIKIHSLKEMPWFVSRNSDSSLQFLFAGFDTTPVKELSLANFATMESNFWEPDLKSYRTFDTVLSYNNSAVGVIWQKHKLNTEAYFSEVFYLSLSTSDKNPTGDVYIDANSEEMLVNKDIIEEPDVPEVIAAIKGSNKDKDKDQEKVAEDSTEKENSKTEEIVEDEVDTSVGKTKNEQSNIGNGIRNHTKVTRFKRLEEVAEKNKITTADKKEDSKINNEDKAESSKTVSDNKQNDKNTTSPVVITEDKLTSEYIQNLLDRIDSMEKSGNTLSKDELLILNSELDAILEYLGK